MYRLQELIRNYGFRLRAPQEGNSHQANSWPQTAEPFMSAFSRKAIERRLSARMRRRILEWIAGKE